VAREHVGYARRWARRTTTWDHHVTTAPGFAKVREALMRVAEPKAGDVAIDLGAGTGFVTLALAPLVAEVTAVDFARPMLEALEDQARASGVGNVSTLQADLALLDRPEASVDLVVSSYALHHLQDSDKRLLVERSYRWLRPGGRIVIADMMFGRGLSGRDRQILLSKVVVLARKGPGGLWRIAKNAVRFGLRKGGELPVTPEFWQQALEAAGFSEVRFEPVVAEAGLVFGRRSAAT
jgi:ubiquinone/menaquinone biosynthesis C-methylase UbiE